MGGFIVRGNLNDGPSANSTNSVTSKAPRPVTPPPPSFTVGTTHVGNICSPFPGLTKKLSISDPFLGFLGPNNLFPAGLNQSSFPCSASGIKASLTASSEQLMWRCICYLSSEAFTCVPLSDVVHMKFLRLVSLNFTSAAVETLGLAFPGRSS